MSETKESRINSRLPVFSFSRSPFIRALTLNLLLLISALYCPAAHAQESLVQKKESSFISLSRDTVEHLSGLIIDHAYLRCPVPEYDPGTVYMFLKNTTGEPVRVTEVSINGITLPQQYIQLASAGWDVPLDDLSVSTKGCKLANILCYWYRVLPNPIPPGEIAEVAVKLAAQTMSLISISVKSERGCSVRRVIQPLDPPLRLSYVGIGKELNTLYVYLENTGKEPASIRSLVAQASDIKKNLSLPDFSISPGGKRCVVLDLDYPLKPGQRVSIKAESTNGDVVVQAVVNAFSSIFPIALENAASLPHMFLDICKEKTTRVSSLSISDAVRSSLGGRYACTVWTCPMHGEGTIRTRAMGIISRCELMRKERATLPSAVVVCRKRKERAYSLFGELADILCINPVQRSKDSLGRHPMAGERCIAWLTQLAKWACEPRPLFTTVVVGRYVPYFSGRAPTPGEVRLMVYYMISRGSKGILYREGWPPGGLVKESKLKRELRSLNSELQILKRFLAIGEPVQSVASCTDSNVEANTILCGNRAIVLILINQSVRGFGRDDVKDFIWGPRRDFRVSIRTPFEIKDVYEVGGGFSRFEFNKTSNGVSLDVDRLNLTRQFVLTSDPKDFGYDSDHDGISDIKEVSLFGTHPDAPE